MIPSGGCEDLRAERAKEAEAWKQKEDFEEPRATCFIERNLMSTVHSVLIRRASTQPSVATARPKRPRSGICAVLYRFGTVRYYIHLPINKKTLMCTSSFGNMVSKATSTNGTHCPQRSPDSARPTVKMQDYSLDLQGQSFGYSLGLWGKSGFKKES